MIIQSINFGFKYGQWYNYGARIQYQWGLATMWVKHLSNELGQNTHKLFNVYSIGLDVVFIGSFHFEWNINCIIPVWCSFLVRCPKHIFHLNLSVYPICKVFRNTEFDKYITKMKVSSSVGIWMSLCIQTGWPNVIRSACVKISSKIEWKGVQLELLMKCFIRVLSRYATRI